MPKSPGIKHMFLNFLHRPNAPACPRRRCRSRTCRIEELENRELLAVTFGEFEALRAQYAELDLSATMADYNIIEITAEHSAKTLQDALDTAATTAQDDLIVVRTHPANPAVDLGNSTLSINIDSTKYGGVAVVALGSGKLEIAGSATSGVLVAANGNVALGGIVLKSTNEALNTDGVLRISSSVQLVTSQLVRTVEREGSNGNYSASGGEYVYRADAGSLMPLTAGSPIGSKTYEVDVQIVGTQYVFLTGLSWTDYSAVIAAPGTWLNNLNALEPYDAEKSNNDDSLVCWAASAANMLAYSGWGNVNGFETEDDIFDYFVSYFTNKGGHQYYANEWFLTGKYQMQGKNGWSQMKTTGGGGFYPSVTYANANGVAGFVEVSAKVTVANALNSAVEKLRNGYAVGMGISFSSGGHAQTFWGYEYDTSKVGTSEYYVSIFITDSDDNKWGGVNAPNILRNYSIVWSGTNCTIDMRSYGAASFVDFTWLAPFAAPLGFSSTKIESNSVSLAWQSRKGATGYEIEWWAKDDSSSVFSKTVSGKNTTTCSIPGLEPGTAYEFRLRMVCGDYSSEWGSALSVTTIPPNFNTHDWNKVSSQGLDDYALWDIVGGESRLKEIRVAGAFLTGTLDLSGCEALTYLDCSGNQLTGLNLSGCLALEYVDCSGNQLTFSTLPQGNYAAYNYDSQGWVPIPSTLPLNATLDLSRESLIGTAATLYAWFYDDDTPIAPGLYTASGGKFIFHGLESGHRIYCEMTSAAFDGLVLRTTLTTTAEPILSSANPVKPKVKRSATTINSITLTWTLPAKNADYIAENYTVICITANNTATIGRIVIMDGKASVEITGLNHGKIYKFSVMAKNADNSKQTNTPVLASTKRYTAVKSLKVDKVNKPTLSSITLTSAKPSLAKETEGFIIMVSAGRTKIGTLTVTDTDPAAAIFTPAPGYAGTNLTLTTMTLDRDANDTITKFSVTIDGLSATKRYTFAVKAFAGGLTSGIAKVYASTARYAAVTKVKAIEKTDTAVTLTWTASKFTETTHYEIVWKEGGMERSQTLPVPVLDGVSIGAVSEVVSGLTPSKRYTFTIWAVVKEGDVVLQRSLSAKVSVTTAKPALVFSNPVL